MEKNKNGDHAADVVGINLQVVLDTELKAKLEELAPDLEDAVGRAVERFFQEYNGKWPDGVAPRINTAHYFVKTRLRGQIGNALQQLAANSVCFALSAKTPLHVVFKLADDSGKVIGIEEQGITVPGAQVESMMKLAAQNVKEQLPSRGRGRPEQTKDEFLQRLTEAIRKVGKKQRAVATALDWETEYLRRRCKHHGFQRWSDAVRAADLIPQQ